MFFVPTRSICELLARHRANISVVNTRHQSPLHLAARAGLSDVLGWMAHHIPRLMLDMRDSDDCTAQDYATSAKLAPDIIQKLHTWEPLLAQRKRDSPKGPEKVLTE